MALLILFGLPNLLFAENNRSIPTDFYLIIDGSESFRHSRNDAVSWINSQVVDRLLIDGDRITIWRAGNSAEIIYSGEVSGAKNEVKNSLSSLAVDASSADFSGALIDAHSRVSRTNADRISYTMLVKASAENLEGTLTGSVRNLLRWSRSEKYERWQVLIIGLDIGQRAQTAATAVMSSLR